jgi:hypothetical protein
MFYLLFCVSKLLHIEVLFMALFPGFLLRCSFVASADVVLYPIVLLGMAKIRKSLPTWNNKTEHDQRAYRRVSKSSNYQNKTAQGPSPPTTYSHNINLNITAPFPQLHSTL